MPFKRRGFKRPIRRNRRARKRPNIIQQRRPNLGNMSVAQLAAYAAKGVSMMKGIINSELKRYDAVFNLNPGQVASVNVLTATAQGDDADNRDGNSILGKYLSFRMDGVMNTNATETVIRIMVFVDTQNQGALPSASEVLQSPSNTLSPLNIDNTQRFTILLDKYILLSDNGDRVIVRKFYVPLNFHLRYTGSAASTYNKNNIFMLTQSDEATNTPVVNIYSRLAFYDN